MFSIFKKEVNLFLSSLIGYMSIAVFLLGTGLFVWFFPDYSIIDFGISTLEPCIVISTSMNRTTSFSMCRRSFPR